MTTLSNLSEVRAFQSKCSRLTNEMRRSLGYEARYSSASKHPDLPYSIRVEGESLTQEFVKAVARVPNSNTEALKTAFDFVTNTITLGLGSLVFRSVRAVVSPVNSKVSFVARHYNEIEDDGSDYIVLGWNLDDHPYGCD